MSEKVDEGSKHSLDKKGLDDQDDKAMDVDEDDWFTDEQKKIKILEVANQYRQKDMLLNLQFNGAGIHHDGGGFSTDISETCRWLTQGLL